MIELTIKSRDHTAFIPITHEIQRVVTDQDWKEGVLTIFVPHTTAGITIQENADPDVVQDLLYVLEKAVPWKDPRYHHVEGNTAAHVKSAMMGSSVQCLVENGKILMGTWQGIFCVNSMVLAAATFG